MGDIESHIMSTQHSVYYQEDEEDLADWVEQYEGVLGGRSDMYKRAIIVLKREHGEHIESMASKNEGRDTLV